MTRPTTPSGFGKHVRSLRRARGITQQIVAELSGLSADTIRRLEHEEFSPSLNTLQCLVDAFEIRLSTLFLGYELDDTANVREIVDMLRGRSASDVLLVSRLVRHSSFSSWTRTARRPTRRTSCRAAIKEVESDDKQQLRARPARE